jgi:sugar phosphate permease
VSERHISRPNLGAQPKPNPEQAEHPSPPGNAQPAQNNRHIQRTTIALLFLAGIVNFLDRSSLSVANGPIRADLHLSGTRIGALLSVFSLTYGFAQLPTGWLLDRFGTRLLLALGLGFWSAAQLATGLVRSFTTFIPMRVALGAGEAPFMAAGVKAIHGWFPPEDRGWPMGVLNASTVLGQALAPPLLTTLLLATSWRAMFAVIGGAGLILAAAWYPLYRDAPIPGPTQPRPHARAPESSTLSPAELPANPLTDSLTVDPSLKPSLRPRLAPSTPPGPHASTPAAPHLSPDSHAPATLSFATWLSLFRKRTMWGMILGFSGVNYTAWLYLSWLPGYLELARHVSLAHAGWLAAIPFLMGAAGMFASGLAADSLVRSGRNPLLSRKLLIVTGMIASAAATFLVARAPTTHSAVFLIGAALFCIHFAGTAAWGLVQFAAPPHLVATVSTLQNFGSFLCASAAPVATGFLLDRTHSFTLALTLCSTITLLGAAAYLTLVKAPIRAN